VCYGPAGAFRKHHLFSELSRMDTNDIRKYLHDLSNALNAAKINAYLLRRMHGDVLDKETVDGLDSSLFDAEKLVSEFHRRVHSEMIAPEKATT
jgi:hypothetical protein